MKTIWKFELEPGRDCSINMPEGAQIIHVGVQENKPMMWAVVDPDALVKARGFLCIPTGAELPAGELFHWGSFIMENPDRTLWPTVTLVFHLFEFTGPGVPKP